MNEGHLSQYGPTPTTLVQYFSEVRALFLRGVLWNPSKDFPWCLCFDLTWWMVVAFFSFARREKEIFCLMDFELPGTTIHHPPCQFFDLMERSRGTSYQPGYTYLGSAPSSISDRHISKADRAGKIESQVISLKVRSLLSRVLQNSHI